MPPAYLYHPVWFYFITILIAFVLSPIATFLSNSQDLEQYLFPLLLFGLCVPCITALAMIYGSHNEVLINDFWKRLLLFKISSTPFVVTLLLMPCIVLLATWISLIFGYSADQFSFSKEISVIQGWGIFGIAIPFILAPIIEELGWRGYGVDSLRVHFNLFTTSLLFGVLWALWHLPVFFIKGYYHNQLWQLGIVYVINFFVSVFVVSFLLNWVYYKTGRSIPAVIVFHSVLNLSSMLFKTEPFTKCIVTLLLCVISFIVIVCDYNFFFGESVS